MQLSGGQLLAAGLDGGNSLIYSNPSIYIVNNNLFVFGQPDFLKSITMF